MTFKSGFIAIVGRPNAGKSTLLNKVLGSEISIVTPKAQTTRERVLGILTETNKGQIVFVDTPGIHKAREGGINEYMVREAEEALIDTVCAWYIIDPGFKTQSGMEHERVVLDLLGQAKVPVFALFNKCDLSTESRNNKPGINEASLQRLEAELRDEASKRGIKLEGVFRVSAVKGDGLDALLTESWKKLPEGPLYYPDTEQLSDRPLRFFVAEKIREQLFMQLGDELPYACAVRIDNYEESTKLPRIEATIFVERDSQKGMVIGKGGHKIRDIGTEARRKIEDFTGGSVFLGLKVEVLKNWTRNAEFLKRLGYNLPEHKSPKGKK